MAEEKDFWEPLRRPPDVFGDVRAQMDANYKDFVATTEAFFADVRSAMAERRPPPAPPFPRLKLPPLPAPLPPPDFPRPPELPKPPAPPAPPMPGRAKT